MGAIARHGPHQVAQKSTRTGLSDFKTSWSKFASVTSTIPLPAILFLLVMCRASRQDSSICPARRCVGISASLTGTQPTIVTPLLDARGVAEVARPARVMLGRLLWV